MNFLHKLNNYLWLLVFIYGLWVFPGCSDDLGLKHDVPEENFTGITLLVPDVENAAAFGATRTDGYANTRAYDQLLEANFNTLYIAAVDESGNVNVSLKTTSNGQDNEGYSKYRVNLSPGKYKFYIVANLNRYLINDDGSSATFNELASSENVIRNLILNFSSNRPLEPGFLPMACLNEEIRVGSNAANAKPTEDAKGFINVPSGENIYIYADLQYLCSKVRYTILFDRDKSNFASTDIIDVHRNVAEDYPYATNLRRQTALNKYEDAKTPDTGFIKQTADDVNSANASWPIFLDRYVYGNFDFYSATDKDKIKESLGELSLWTSDMGQWTSGEFLKKRAWQGVAYLPENLLKDNPTLLRFPYSFNGATGAESPRTIKLDWENKGESSVSEFGIKRGKSYDVYALITTPDPEQWELNVIPAEWTLQNLAYELHGPYELIVETTAIQKLSMQEDATFWFRSDVPPEEIGFASPYVLANGEFKDLYIGGVLKDEKGDFVKNENGDYLFHVGFNLDIPYSILNKINADGGFEFPGNEYFPAQKFTLKDISFFHIIAGSLYKRIEIENLDLNPYLIVTPQTIIIDTRELYTSGLDNTNYEIDFETNVDIDPTDNISFTVTDSEGLISKGVGEGVLKIGNPGNYAVSSGLCHIKDKKGKFTVNVKDIITGSPYWNHNNEYTLTFTLSVPNNEKFKVVEQTVVIKVRPFSGNYTIHFRDNTKPWAVPHIWVYQLLTLPNDLPAIEPGKAGHDPSVIHANAGKIVGYIENNPTSGLQWNGATQYVFSNNVSFKGWKGYGGPDENDPWVKATVTYTNPKTEGDNHNANNSTMGFVMFGDPESDGSWNYGYSYLNTNNGINKVRYNFDVNFNYDHEVGLDNWSCDACRGMSPDYNGGNDDRFYTGIAMERESDGWWKYTLTGVAQPGRTMIIFANWHEPWFEEARDYAAEDYRWPGDYETGLPLFDFEDNEGWFLFDGNTTNADQKFTDDKPVNIIPHYFNSAITSNMRIEVKDPSSGPLQNISVNGSSYSRGGQGGKSGYSYYDITGLSSTEQTISVVANGKTFKLYPKNFIKSGAGYVTAKPLYLEFCKDIKLFVKWNDNVSINEGWGGKQYSYYQPPTGGSPYLSVYWTNNNGTLMLTRQCEAKEYGNYKYKAFDLLDAPDNVSAKDQISLRLCTSPGTGNFYKLLKVEDLPQYYNPSEGYFQINWHMLKSPNV